MYNFLLKKNSTLEKIYKIFFFTSTFFGCKYHSTQPVLYPSQKQIEINYLCNLPFFEEYSSHNKWKKSKSSWLIISKGESVVYFANNQTYKLKNNIDISISEGKYKCTLQK